jgi:site-specific recombinase XerD
MTIRTDTTLEDTRAQEKQGLSPGDLSILVPDFVRSLKARNLSKRTVGIYSDSCRLFVDYLVLAGLPTEARQVTKAHVETYIESQLAEHKPATACARFNALSQLFRWLEEESLILETPMARMRRPRVPVETVHVLELEDLRKLLATAPPKSRDFLDVRDRAVMLLFCDTGMRLSELAGLKMDDIDRERDCASVMGKGHKPRVCPYTPATATAIDRYLRMRREQKHASLSHLWITRQGYATGSAIYRVIRNRAELAGLGPVHPHQLRHSWAHDGLANGESEGDMMMLGGWSNRKMLERYGRELAADRAIAARRRHGGLGDRL